MTNTHNTGNPAVARNFNFRIRLLISVSCQWKYVYSCDPVPGLPLRPETDPQKVPPASCAECSAAIKLLRRKNILLVEGDCLLKEIERLKNEIEADKIASTLEKKAAKNERRRAKKRGPRKERKEARERYKEAQLKEAEAAAEEFNSQLMNTIDSMISALEKPAGTEEEVVLAALANLYTDE